MLGQFQKQKDEILAVARRHGAFNVRIFGSVSRGDATAESDVDFLVDLERGRSLLDLGPSFGQWSSLICQFLKAR